MPEANELKRVVLASNNAGKLREFASLLNAAGIELIAQGELGVPEAEEPHATFVENALAKARHASKLTGLPALADDSGLCVHALRGAPGVYSARFAQLACGEKSDTANNARLVAELAGNADRRAYYFCVLVLVRHADRVGHVAHVQDHFGIARQDLLKRHSRIGGHGVAEHILAARQRDDLVQI